MGVSGSSRDIFTRQTGARESAAEERHLLCVEGIHASKRHMEEKTLTKQIGVGESKMQPLLQGWGYKVSEASSSPNLGFVSLKKDRMADGLTTVV